MMLEKYKLNISSIFRKHMREKFWSDGSISILGHYFSPTLSSRILSWLLYQRKRFVDVVATLLLIFTKPDISTYISLFTSPPCFHAPAPFHNLRCYRALYIAFLTADHHRVRGCDKSLITVSTGSYLAGSLHNAPLLD